MDHGALEPRRVALRLPAAIDDEQAVELGGEERVDEVGGVALPELGSQRPRTGQRPGDHPLTDILNHRKDVFGPEIDDLVHKLAQLMSPQDMWSLTDWFKPPPTDELAALLRQTYNRLALVARERGEE